MKPSEIKWEDYLPIPWGRTRLFLLWIGTPLLLFLLISAIVLLLLRGLVESPTDRHITDSLSVAVVGSLLVFAGFLNNGDIRAWRGDYHQQNRVGYDAVYRLLENGDLDCEVVSRFHYPRWYHQDGRDNGWVRLPLVPYRPGLIFVVNPPVEWSVTWGEPRTVKNPPSASSVVWVTDAHGGKFEMTLSDLVGYLPRFVGLHRTVGGFVAALLSEVSSLERRERILQHEKGLLEHRLQDARGVMEGAMFSVAHSDRFGNSTAGGNIRQALAAALCRLVGEADDRHRVYKNYMTARRPPRRPKQTVR